MWLHCCNDLHAKLEASLDILCDRVQLIPQPLILRPLAKAEYFEVWPLIVRHNLRNVQRAAQLEAASSALRRMLNAMPSEAVLHSLPDKCCLTAGTQKLSHAHRKLVYVISATEHTTKCFLGLLRMAGPC